MKWSDEFDKIAAAIDTFQAKVRRIKNTAGVVVDDEFYAYAPLPEVLRVTRPARKAAELIVLQDTRGERGLAGAMTRVVHVPSGQWVETDWLMFAVHGIADGKSAVTGARRYSLLGILGLAPIDDDGVLATGRGMLADRNSGQSQAADSAASNEGGERATHGPDGPNTPNTYKIPSWAKSKITRLTRESNTTESEFAEILLTRGGASAIADLDRAGVDAVLEELDKRRTAARQSAATKGGGGK